MENGMNIIIKALTPELEGDYFDFFENRAFTDDSPYRCYCQDYQMTKEQSDAAYKGVEGADMGRVARAAAQKQIASGVMQGYLAYDDDKAIGWCNANDMMAYPVNSYAGERFKLADVNIVKGMIKTVACFEISPEYRMKGIASALLSRVCEDAKKDGYTAVEGFPIIHPQKYEWDFCGPIRLYEKLGFIKVLQSDDIVIMRKEL